MQSYSPIPDSAMDNIPASIPSGLLYRIRKIEGCKREQSVITPISGQGTVRGGQRVIFQLPSNSLVDLSTLEFNFLGTADHGGNTQNTNSINYVKARYFPRNIASIIEALEVRINGVTRQRIDNYGLIYNILSDFSNSTDSTNKNKVGANADPSNKNYSVNGKVFRAAGYPVGLVSVPASANDQQYFSIRQWLGLLGGNGSTSIIHTGILGEVTIEIVLAGGGVLMESQGFDLSGGQVVTGKISAANSEIGVESATVNNASGSVGSQGSNYTLSNIEFRITKYTMPLSFYNAMASVLASGQSYQIWFPNYSTFQGIPTTDKSGTTRFSIASKSLDMIIGTFLLPNRDTIGLPLLGNAGQAGTIDDLLEYGSRLQSFEYHVQNGSSVLLNNSKYFCRNGSGVKSARYIIGGADFKNETIPQMYNGVLRAFNNAQVDILGGTYPGIKSLSHFENTYFAHIHKFSSQTEDSVYTVSGVDAMANSLDIAWEVTGGNNIASVDALIMPSNTAVDITCTPLLIACTNAHIEVSANRAITLFP